MLLIEFKRNKKRQVIGSSNTFQLHKENICAKKKKEQPVYSQLAYLFVFKYCIGLNSHYLSIDIVPLDFDFDLIIYLKYET